MDITQADAEIILAWAIGAYDEYGTSAQDHELPFIKRIFQSFPDLDTEYNRHLIVGW